MPKACICVANSDVRNFLHWVDPSKESWVLRVTGQLQEDLVPIFLAVRITMRYLVSLIPIYVVVSISVGGEVALHPSET
jgi:hypothetical protein